jgi:hypothetical protein
VYFSLNIIRAPEWKDVEMGRGNAAHTGLGKCAVFAGKYKGRTDRRTTLLKRIL